MTTAARPTPAQMPSRRPDTPAAKETPRPPAHREPWQKAVLTSSLPPNFRFVAIALSTHADGTGHIAQQPRLIGLVHNTGINARQVAVALTALRDRGFLRLSPPGGRYDTADLLLTMPRGAAARAHRAENRSNADA
ncbi:hypothetical protein [Streptomyces sp. EN27]|uniref:hypothetical protein n=1 Tax=Streptomyces sp. EN27 TaxID=211464 RepID=UPI000851E981|nr:hypothetical protein [Streptomyces sp. EN27]